MKLAQLAEVSGIAGVVLDSNDPQVLEIGERWRRRWPSGRFLEVRQRPAELGTSQTTTDRLIDYALSSVAADVLLWTHVTSPFVPAIRYDECLQTYWDALEQGFDSLMSVRAIRNFIWNETGPQNYEKSHLKWPRTQDLSPLYEVTSAIFLVSAEVGRLHHDRIGRKPYLFELNAVEALDIDWEVDFSIAEAVFRQRAA